MGNNLKPHTKPYIAYIIRSSRLSPRFSGEKSGNKASHPPFKDSSAFKESNTKMDISYHHSVLFLCFERLDRNNPANFRSVILTSFGLPGKLACEHPHSTIGAFQNYVIQINCHRNVSGKLRRHFDWGHLW